MKRTDKYGLDSRLTMWAKNRVKLIDETTQNRVFEYLGGICKGLECNPVQVGGYLDHVHILCTLSRKIAQAKLLEEIKKERRSPHRR